MGVFLPTQVAGDASRSGVTIIGTCSATRKVFWLDETNKEATCPFWESRLIILDTAINP